MKPSEKAISIVIGETPVPYDLFGGQVIRCTQTQYKKLVHELDEAECYHCIAFDMRPARIWISKKFFAENKNIVDGWIEKYGLSYNARRGC